MANIVLTGGSSGIGASILEALTAQGGHTVLCIGRHPPARGSGLFLPADLIDPDQVESAAEASLTMLGSVEGLINCAGLGRFAQIEEFDRTWWHEMLAVNLTAPFLLIKAFLPGMRAANHGRIINISSDADQVGFAGAGAYCASKFGLLGLAEAVRKELVGTGVTITTVSPARVDTAFNGKSPGDRPISLRPEEVAEVVLNVLASRGRLHLETIRLKSNLE